MKGISVQEPTASPILVFGDDGSPGADVAWLWVCNHDWAGWHIEVLTSTPPVLPRPAADYRPEPVEWSSPHPRRLLGAPSIAIRSIAIPEDPRVVLGSRRDAALVVVAPHHQGRLRGPLTGSTTDWLLQHPPAPLAIVRSAAPVRRALLCTDGSLHARAALTAFARLPLSLQTEAIVLAIDDGRSDAAGATDAALAALDTAGVAANAETRRGRPSAAILDAAEQLDPQLIVLGTRGLTGLKRLRVGSTAGAVARSAPCSVLLACVDDEPT